MNISAFFIESKRCIWRLAQFAAVPLILLPNIAHAGIDVDDLMNIAWEGLWNQNGSPAPLRKWNQPLKVRIVGELDGLHIRIINENLGVIMETAGLEYSFLQPGDETENVLIDVNDASPKLNQTTPCLTHFEWTSSGMKRATVTAKRTSVYKCMLHELGHVMGIEGHPYGKTVMTYFNRWNELSDYDKFIIKARYSQSMRHGTLPFRVLRQIGNKYVTSLASEDERTQARQSIDKFMASVLASMTKYAEGEGEPPIVLHRSGRISMRSMEEGRVPMQYYLGEALLDGDFGIIDKTRGAGLLRKAAAGKSQAAAWSLAVRYQDGKGLEKDPISAYSWYAFTASLGNQAAQKRIKLVEESIAASDLATYQEAASMLQAKLGEQTTKQDGALAK